VGAIANIRPVSVSASFMEHLRRLPPARPLGEFVPGSSGVFLRHDVDHDLDLALEMAFWEREAGHRSTYFILPTAQYASDPRLAAKLLQMQDFGHEIGVHLNFLASWVRGEIASVEPALAGLLGAWRGAGLRIAGCAAHGDRACYEHHFINYWMFRELRPQDPVAAESGLSPEGIPDRDPARHIRYPASHRLERPDGAAFPLWSVSMKESGLAYHATHLAMDRYYSDSGGRWERTPSPFESDLSKGSHQVLMHPEYYRGEPKRVFVVSPARSGSKWLATVAAAGTPCHALHEFSLNHRFDDSGALVAEKRTRSGFARLQGSPAEARALLLHTRQYADRLERDYFECNVYLTHFLRELRLLFPEAQIVGLERDARQVVRSLLNRGWYETPEDDERPRIDDPRWAAAGRFERACLYVAACRAEIRRHADRQVRLEELAADAAALGGFFRSLGIAFYPALAAEAFATRVNASVRDAFPPFEAWSAEQRAAFERTCAGGAAEARVQPAARVRRDAQTLFELHRPRLFRRPKASGIKLRRRGARLEVTGSRTENGRLLLAGGHWRKLVPLLNGWRSDPTSFFTVTCRAQVPKGEIGLFALLYDARGRLLESRQCARVSPSLPEAVGSFRVSEPRCRWVNIALYFPKGGDEERHFVVERLEARRESLSLYR
jgi:hypothetical protein